MIAYLGGMTQDITDEIRKNLIDFSGVSLITMRGERAAFGGIQQVELKGYLSKAAFWILQHQRGYRPFINEIYYTETKEYIF